MSINLITDGWLYPIISRRPLPPPDDAEGVIDHDPTTPCAATGTPTDTPPITPTGLQAAGPGMPTTPCGTTGNDPTITPPAVPAGQEGSETANDEAPKIPGCPEGEAT
jgi:hypothetical protein